MRISSTTSRDARTNEASSGAGSSAMVKSLHADTLVSSAQLHADVYRPPSTLLIWRRTIHSRFRHWAGAGRLIRIRTILEASPGPESSTGSIGEQGPGHNIAKGHANGPQLHNSFNVPTNLGLA
ncbi:unnamed protein product [Peniophora sp. CBMAI 1063]|nr:unnamed protein product [Peniophora sp. CBMAI 1063]